MILVALAAFLPTFAAALLLTPRARGVALGANLVAPVRPDRLHREVRPYGGGIALVATLALVAAPGWVLFIPVLAWFVHEEADPALPVALGAVAFFILGLLDDRYAFRAAPKLAIQFLAAGIAVVGYGVKATVWLDEPCASEAVSILWIVAVANAFNMLDHADGLAAAAGTAAFVALALGQMLVGSGLVPVAALMTAGAIAGFLVYNFPPAKLFMGDAGSMLVGYLLAALTMEAQYYFPEQGTSKLVVLVPLALLAVPLFDMVCVVAARLWRRQNPMKGDVTSHLAHRMLARGWSPRGIVAFAAGATAVTGAASVSMYFLSGPALAAPWLVVAAVLAAMLLVRRPPRRPVHAEAARGSSQNQP